MPTYEYKCNKCGYVFEQFQKITDKPLEKCPKCKGAVKRLISSGAGIIFKGKGFYQTDYKTSEAKKDRKEGDAKKTGGCDKCGACPLDG